MNPVHPSTRLYLSVIPFASLAWSLILQHISGPFFISRTDPEYVYLFNGMNVALLEFDRIGHVDHPGTPFQLLTGLFIRVIYWISGEGGILKDVISNPEKYITWSSFFLAGITSWILYRHSVLVYRFTGRLSGSLVFPFAILFIYILLIDLPSRYIPDRLQMMLLLLFSNVYIRYYFEELSEKQFALRSGILMGLGLTTKINFFPLVLLPLFLIKKAPRYITYGGTLAATVLLTLVPIYDKFNQFWEFAVRIFQHDSLYGSGESQVINFGTFFGNILLVFSENLPFVLFFLLALGLVTGMFIRKEMRQKNQQVFRLLTGLLIVSITGILMVAKHYKNYYMIPLFTVSALGYFIFWSYFMSWSGIKRYVPVAFAVLGLFYFLWILNPLRAMYSHRVVFRQEMMATKQALDGLISAQGYLLVEPTWMAGPMVENGLVYGNSYLSHRFYFYNDFEKVYPNVLTYEGKDNPLWYLRLMPADNEAIFKSGRTVYLYSSPGRNAETILEYLRAQADSLSILVAVDIAYTNHFLDRKIYRIQNASGWKNTRTIRCGFEQVVGDQVYSDDGLQPLAGSFRQARGKAAGGHTALVLDKEQSESPAVVLDNVQKGDFVSVRIKRSRSAGADMGYLAAEYRDPDSALVRIQENKRVTVIHSDWEMVRLNFTVTSQPSDGTLKCFYRWQGEGSQVVDDLTVEHDSK